MKRMKRKKKRKQRKKKLISQSKKRAIKQNKKQKQKQTNQIHQMKNKRTDKHKMTLRHSGSHLFILALFVKIETGTAITRPIGNICGYTPHQKIVVCC